MLYIWLFRVFGSRGSRKREFLVFFGYLVGRIEGWGFVDTVGILRISVGYG